MLGLKPVSKVQECVVIIHQQRPDLWSVKDQKQQETNKSNGGPSWYDANLFYRTK